MLAQGCPSQAEPGAVRIELGLDPETGEPLDNQAKGADFRRDPSREEAGLRRRENGSALPADHGAELLRLYCSRIGAAQMPVTPDTPDNDHSTSGGDPTWKEVLEFVRDQSDKEVKGIERLFERAVKYFGWLVVATAIIAGFFGFSTYTSLRDQVLRDKTEAELQKLITESVAAKVQSAMPIIIASSKEEARRQLAKSFEPRTLSAEQRANILQALSQYQGAHFYIESGYYPDAETVQFAHSLEELFKASGWIEALNVKSIDELKFSYVKKRVGGSSFGSQDLGVFWTPPGLIVLSNGSLSGKAVKTVLAPLITPSINTSELSLYTIPASDNADVFLIVGPKSR